MSIVPKNRPGRIGFLAAIVAALAVCGFFIAIAQHPSASHPPAGATSIKTAKVWAGGDAAGASGHKVGQQATQPLTFLENTPFSKEFGKEGTTPERELELIELAFNDYLRYVKERYRSPFGHNAELVSLLVGGNPYHIAAIPPDHPRIREDGELTDRWGVSFHIHPLSATAIEIRSAGPDGKLWTDDDLRRASLRGQEIIDGLGERQK